MFEEVFTIFVEDESRNCVYIKKESFLPNSAEAHNAKVDYRKFLLYSKYVKPPKFIIVGEEKEMSEMESLKFLKQQLLFAKSYPDKYKEVQQTK